MRKFNLKFIVMTIFSRLMVIIMMIIVTVLAYKLPLLLCALYHDRCYGHLSYAHYCFEHSSLLTLWSLSYV
jgi:hypothetical protein